MTIIERTIGPSMCGHDGCGNPSATLDYFNGRRGTLHAPRFDGDVVVRLMRREGHRSALAYVRAMAAIEAAA